MPTLAKVDAGIVVTVLTAAAGAGLDGGDLLVALGRVDDHHDGHDGDEGDEMPPMMSMRRRASRLRCCSRAAAARSRALERRAAPACGESAE